jgi:hypothetical protein
MKLFKISGGISLLLPLETPPELLDAVGAALLLPLAPPELLDPVEEMKGLESEGIEAVVRSNVNWRVEP